MKTERSMVRSLARVLSATALLLSVPLVAMMVTSEVAWDAVDFAVMGTLIAGTGLLYEVGARISGSVVYRAALAVALAGLFLLIWINLAVGIIGGEDNPANAMYLGVFAVAFLGTCIARLRPRAMARAMFGTASAVALVAVAALVFRLAGSASGAAVAVGVNAMFVALFAGSGLLFREAARRRPERRVA
jgi:hypothetical protein